MFTKIESNPVLSIGTDYQERGSLFRSKEVLTTLRKIAVKEDCNTFLVSETGEIFTIDEIGRAMCILDLINDYNTFILSKQQK